MSGGMRMGDGPLDMDALLSGKDAALLASVSVNVIVNWRNRGWLPVATRADGSEIRDRQGRPRYRLRDVIVAESRTHERGRKLAASIIRRSPAQLAA